MGKIIPPFMAAGYRVPEPQRVQIVRDVDGDISMELALDDLIQAYIFWSPNGYDRQAITLVKHYVKPGHVFVDLGANVGYYSLIAAKLVGPRGRVVAVEADPENNDRLQTNIVLNNFHQVVSVSKGVADRQGVLQLHRDLGHNQGAHTFANGAASSAGPQVQVDTLDRILQEVDVSQVDFIKLDIQGFEARALKDSEVFQHRPIIMTEVAEAELALAGSSKEEYLSLLLSHGYSIHPIHKDPLNYLCLPART
jgi:FkbM family methyltransferase